MVALNQQGHFGGQRLHAGNLPDQPARVDYRQASLHTVHAAFVDDQREGERVTAGVDDFRRQGVAAVLAAQAQRLPQFGVFPL